MITQNLADRLDWLTDLAVLSFNRMVEIELLEGQKTTRFQNARAAYERHLERLGQAITDAVGVPTRKEENYYAEFH